MQIGAEGLGGAAKSRAARSLTVAIAGALALLLAGCSSSYNPVNWFGDNTLKPQQIALPAEDAADQDDLPQGLSGDAAGHSYADGSGRSDVTVVRPLRNEPPPKVAVGAVQPAPVSRAVAQSGDMPTQAPGAPRLLGDEASASKAPGATVAADARDGGLQGLDTFSPENYGLSYLAATVPFGHGLAHLSGSDMAALRQVVAQYRKSGGVITVVGHVSSRTGEMVAVSHKIANFDESVRRAEVVARALLKQGVPAKALYVGAVSDAEPVYQEVMPLGEAYNRRTEIFLNH